MRIPEVGALAAILHKEVEQKVFIHQVSHDRGAFWRVVVQSGHDIYANGDTVFWLEDGKRLQTFVRDLKRIHGEIYFALVAIEG